jgi:hypothetical protein
MNLEIVLFRLPANARRRLFYYLYPEDVVRLARSSRRLYTLIMNDDMYWRATFMDTFYMPTGQYTLAEERVWMEQQLACFPQVLNGCVTCLRQAYPYAFAIANWAHLYAQCCLLGRMWYRDRERALQFILHPHRCTCPNNTTRALIGTCQTLWLEYAPWPRVLEVLLAWPKIS